MNELSKWHVIIPLLFVAIFCFLRGAITLYEGHTTFVNVTLNSGTGAIKYGFGWLITGVLVIMGMIAFNRWWNDSDY
ncbi:MAG: hypothetical protein KF784_09755 [Fimbriimonadaceae bacterium]|nr:hypothetical protein [Fimbriimonadaceae bacterium]